MADMEGHLTPKTQREYAMAAAYGLGLSATAAVHYDMFELAAHTHGTHTHIAWFPREVPTVGQYVRARVAATSRVLIAAWFAAGAYLTYVWGWWVLPLYALYTAVLLLIGAGRRGSPRFTQIVPDSETALRAVLDHANNATGDRLTSILADAWKAHRDDLRGTTN